MQRPLLSVPQGLDASKPWLKASWSTQRREELLALAAAQTPLGALRKQSWVSQAAMTVLGGTLLWLVTLSLAVGFATFAFLGMPEKTSLGIGMQVLGSAVVYAWLSFRSKNPGSCVQASPIPSIYVALFIQVVKVHNLSDSSAIATVLVFVWLTTLAQGFAFVVSSRYHVGDLLQYFPVCVTTGYNGGIGLLILNSAISMMAGVNPLQDFSSFLQPEPLKLACPGVAIALVVYPLSLTKACAGPAFKVLPILTVIATFYIILSVTGTSLDEARDSGWIFPYFGFLDPTAAFRAVNFTELDWDLLKYQATPLLLPMMFISLIAQYASLGAILLQIKDTVEDADRETRLLGEASVISGCLGSMSNLSGMAPSALLLGVVGKDGVRGASLAVCGGLHLLLFSSGFPLVSYLPKCSIAGCLLLPISFRMIRGALFDSLSVSTWSDYIVIWVMSLATLLLNIQWGLASGFVLTVFRLLFEYAHFDVVHRRETIYDICTAKERSERVRLQLDNFGDDIATFRLRGVLFFGNCVSLKAELTTMFPEASVVAAAAYERSAPFLASPVMNTRAALTSPAVQTRRPSFKRLASKGGIETRQGGPGRPPKYVVVDFTEVVYVDSSVWEMLAFMSRRARKNAASEVVLCALDGTLVADLRRQGEKLVEDLNIEHVGHSYHLTLEKIEDKLLDKIGSSPQEEDGWSLFTGWVARGLPKNNDGKKVEVQCDGDVCRLGAEQDGGSLKARLENFFEEKKFSSSEMVRREGSVAEAFYWVMSGEFHVFTTPLSNKPGGTGGNAAMLHRKLRQGFAEGVEMFCYEPGTSDPMRAYTSIQCKEQGSLVLMTAASFERMRSEDPPLALALMVAVATARERLRRRLIRYRFEPEAVEVDGGCRRHFTMDMSCSDICSSHRSRSLRESITSLGLQWFRRLQDSAIMVKDKEPLAAEWGGSHVTTGTFA